MSEMDSETHAKPRMIPAQEAIALARGFLEGAVGVSQARVEGISIPSDGGWSVEFAAFLSNPNFGVENGGMKRQVYDEAGFVVTLDAQGNVRGMSKV